MGCQHHRRTFLHRLLGLGALVSLKSLVFGVASAAESQKTIRYECPPCGCPNDNKEFDKPGKCPACGMTLREKRTGASATEQAGFICPPCGCKADGQIFTKPGRCPECKMPLVPNKQPANAK